MIFPKMAENVPPAVAKAMAAKRITQISNSDFKGMSEYRASYLSEI
jgi:hypothetical protein